MILKYIVLTLFTTLFSYSLVRPFSSVFAKLFMLFGSALGFVSVIDSSYINRVAGALGVHGGGKELYLYVILVTAFMFFCHSWEKFKSIEKKMSTIVKALAIEQSKK